MTICRGAAARLVCIDVLCITLTSWPAFGMGNDHANVQVGGALLCASPGVVATQTYMGALSNGSASVSVFSTPEAVAVFVEILALGLACQLVKRRRTELATVYAWFTQALEKTDEAAKHRATEANRLTKAQEQRSERMEKRQGQRRVEAKSPLGRRSNPSPQRSTLAG